MLFLANDRGSERPDEYRFLKFLPVCMEGALKEPILYLSLYFKTHRRYYYELLQRVREKGDWEAWLEFFLEGVRETSDQAADTAKQILALFEDDRKKIEGLGRPAASASRVYQYLQLKPILSVPATFAALKLTVPTVRKSIGHLTDLGLVREITGKQRDRLYVYSSYLDILNQGTEPL